MRSVLLPHNGRRTSTLTLWNYVRYIGNTMALPLRLLVLLIAATSTARAQQAAPLGSPPPALSAVWRDGFLIESDDGAFRLHIGALVQADGRLFLNNADPT